jgi:hypothetical protein
MPHILSQQLPSDDADRARALTGRRRSFVWTATVEGDSPLQRLQR